MKLLISIVPKDLSDDVIKIVQDYTIDYQTIVPGLGTAPTEILEFLSIGETEKNVILSVVDDQDVSDIMSELIEKLDFLGKGEGVAFTLTFDGISKQAYKYLYQE